MRHLLAGFCGVLNHQTHFKISKVLGSNVMRTVKILKSHEYGDLEREVDSV